MEKITSIYTHFHFSLANVATYWVSAVAEPACCPVYVCMCVMCVRYVRDMCGQWADSPGLRVVLTPCGEAE